MTNVLSNRLYLCLIQIHSGKLMSLLLCSSFHMVKVQHTAKHWIFTDNGPSSSPPFSKQSRPGTLCSHSCHCSHPLQVGLSLSIYYTYYWYWMENCWWAHGICYFILALHTPAPGHHRICYLILVQHTPTSGHHGGQQRLWCGLECRRRGN